MVSALIELFFNDECNEYVADVLRRELASDRDAYLTFNRFNVRIDRESSTVVVEDELDVDGIANIGIADFAARLAMQR